MLDKNFRQWAGGQLDGSGGLGPPIALYPIALTSPMFCTGVPYHAIPPKGAYRTLLPCTNGVLRKGPPFHGLRS